MMGNDGIITGPDRLVMYIDWSEPDFGYVATCERYPRLWCLAPTRDSAQAGLMRAIADVLEGE